MGNTFRGVQRSGEREGGERGRIAVKGWVAHIEGDGVVAVGSSDVGEPLHRLCDGVVPPDPLPGAVPAPEGLAQTFRVVVDVHQPDRLGADVATAEGVLGISPDREHPVSGHLERQAAHRLAQRAGPVPRRDLVRGHRLTLPALPEPPGVERLVG